MTDTSSTSNSPSSKIDSTVAHSVRIWNYWLGGKDNFGVDRQVGDQILEILPDVARLARASRALLVRVVTHLAGESGIRQFLDIGTGLPTANNTHEVAQAIAPTCRVVYVDNDPLVLAHARALLVGSPQGATDYIDADLHEPDKILQGAAHTLDFAEPVAVTLMGILHHITDDDEARAIVARLVDAVPSGSYLAMSHGTNVIHREASDEVVRRWNEVGGEPIALRTPQEIARFYDGMEMVEPGVVSTSRWRPDPADVGTAEVDQFCAVGRKP